MIELYENTFTQALMKPYADALKQPWEHARPLIDVILREHTELLLWCHCGAVCLEKNDKLHKADCYDTYKAPSIVIHLAMSLSQRRIESLCYITQGIIDGDWVLTSEQWCGLLDDVLKTNHKDIIELFTWRVLDRYEVLRDVLKEAYAVYVYKIFLQVSVSHASYPRLNRSMVSHFMQKMLPLMEQLRAWSLFMPRINQQKIGDIFLAQYNWVGLRETLVRDYGVLWRIEGVSPLHGERIKSLIHYILWVQMPNFLAEHKRWLATVYHSAKYKPYLETEVVKLINFVMKGQDVKRIKFERWAIEHYVPVPAAVISRKDSLRIRLWESCCCFNFKFFEQKEPLLQEEVDYGF